MSASLQGFKMMFSALSDDDKRAFLKDVKAPKKKVIKKVKPVASYTINFNKDC